MVSWVCFWLAQGSEIPRTWILEVRWGWKQVFPSCYWTVICYIKRFGYLHFREPVCSHLSPLFNWLEWSYQPFVIRNWNQVCHFGSISKYSNLSLRAWFNAKMLDWCFKFSLLKIIITPSVILRMFLIISQKHPA